MTHDHEHHTHDTPDAHAAGTCECETCGHAHDADTPLTPLAVWVMMLLILLLGDGYLLFLRPAFGWLLIGSLTILLLCLIAVRNDPGHRAAPRRRGLAAWAKMGVLVLPLFFLFMTRWEPLGAYAFELRFIETKPLDLGGEALPPSADDDSPAVEVSFADLQTDFARLMNRRIVTEAMAFHDDKLPPGHFRLFRFRITCCVADAQPVWAVVHSETPPPGGDSPWVRVEGLLTRRGGMPFIWAEKVEPIKAPKQPYVY